MTRVITASNAFGRSSNSHADQDTLTTLDCLAGDLSSAVLGLHADEMASTIEGVLRQVVELVEVDRASLMQASEDGPACQPAHTFARAGIPPVTLDDLSALVQQRTRLRGNEPMIFNRVPDDLPAAGRRGRATGRRGETMRSRLVLPVEIEGRNVCTLDVVTFREYRTWTPPLVQRLSLITQIIAGALYRGVQGQSLRAMRDELDRIKGPVGAETTYLRQEVDDLGGFHEIVGESPSLRTCLAQIVEVAPTDATVLLLGETGTGKDLFARALHQRSARHGHAMISVNCAALPSALIESELFGHERGAFTGAVSQRQGRFELAHRGTLFLDEIGDMPLELQAKLLRVLQDGEFERLGSCQKHKADVRVIAATNHDLAAMVAEGRFRRDLFYRLNVFPIRLPPLRERPADIPRLVWYIIHRRQKALRRSITQVPDAVMARLQRFGWPGNVRELQNVVERAMIHSRGNTLVVDDGLRDSGAENPPGDSGSTLDDAQRRHIKGVLDRCQWRINGAGNAAEQLALHPNTLRFRMKKLGLTRPQPAPRGDRGDNIR